MTKEWVILDIDRNYNIQSIPESNILLENLELGNIKTYSSTSNPHPSQKKINYIIFLTITFNSFA